MCFPPSSGLYSESAAAEETNGNTPELEEFLKVRRRRSDSVMPTVCFTV